MSLMGVAIVTYNSHSDILVCLESLLTAEQSERLRIVIVDNASTDGTVSLIESWARGRTKARWPENCPIKANTTPKPVSISSSHRGRRQDRLTLVQAGQNGGFAAGTNLALRILRDDPDIDRFWILNPDSIIPPETPKALMGVTGEFGLMGGRVIYAETPSMIQSDGGKVDPRTGRTISLGLGQPLSTNSPELAELDFVNGANMVASPEFLRVAGPMPEDYFLYYEEVDWAQRRAHLPLTYCDRAAIFHTAGGSIGSPTLDRGPSLLSHHTKHRSRMIYMRRYHPNAVFLAYGYGLAKAIQVLLRQGPRHALAVLSGLFSCSPEFASNKVGPYATAVATAAKRP